MQRRWELWWPHQVLYRALNSVVLLFAFSENGRVHSFLNMHFFIKHEIYISCAPVWNKSVVYQYGIMFRILGRLDNDNLLNCSIHLTHSRWKRVSTRSKGVVHICCIYKVRCYFAYIKTYNYFADFWICRL